MRGTVCYSLILFNRDLDVSFTPRSLRQIFNLPRVKDCNYQRLRVNKAMISEMAAVLCPAGVKGLGNQIDKQHLGFHARVWLRFINNCIMPTVSYTNVGPDRIALLYCFMTQQPVDIARIICSSMAQLISNRSNKTYFGSIIHAI